MEQKSNSHYSLMVIGNNPDELIKKYDKSLKVEPYIKYHYKDAGQLRKKSIELYEDLLKNKERFNKNDFFIDALNEKISELKSLSDFEYYSNITNGYDYNENGDAVTSENPDGKWDECRFADGMLIPFILKDGNKSYKAKVSDIDWDIMHRHNYDTYTTCWDIVNGKREAKTDKEKIMLENMNQYREAVTIFDSADKYANFNTSYWNCATLNKEGWFDWKAYTRYEWITQYYDRFIKNLPKDTLLSIYDYSIEKE